MLKNSLSKGNSLSYLVPLSLKRATSSASLQRKIRKSNE
jgi:hypothetical protein